MADTDRAADVLERSGGISAEKLISNLFPARKIDRVVLVAPPDVDSSLFNWLTCKRGRYSNYPPYGLMLLSAGLNKVGIATRIINLNNAVLRGCTLSNGPEEFDFDATWRQELDEAMLDFEPDLFAVTCMFTQTHDSLAAVCAQIFERHPNVPIAIGGVHVTNALISHVTTEKLVESLPQASLFFTHESDVSFRWFAEVVRQDRPANELRQVAIRDGDRLVHFAGRVTPEGDELNAIPDHNLMDPRDLSKWGKVGAYTFLRSEDTVFSTVLSNRGCRAQCTFCSVRNFNGVGVRRRSVQSVIDELLMLRYDYDVRHIMWLDDDFLYDRSESLKLMSEMVRQNVDLTWDCTNGVLASSCTPDLISAASESGCLGLNIGMESGNPDVLRKIRKPASVGTLMKAAEVLRDFPDIFARVFLIIGFPHETFGQMLDTFNVSKEMGLDWYQIQVLQPLPNTPIFDQMMAEGLVDISDFKNVRYSGGTYGRAAKVTETGRDMLDRDFKNIFVDRVLDEEVPKDLFESIWAHMTFHLNYASIPRETRDVKLRQFQRYLRHITDVIAPNDAMALFYLGDIQQRLENEVDAELVSRLDDLTRTSQYWGERFTEFGLSIDDLRRSVPSTA
jgi:radical SAM superfamily enzyme YgiQ (UPF0313 family)